MAINDITKDEIRSKPATDQYKTNYDRIRWTIDPKQVIKITDPRAVYGTREA